CKNALVKHVGRDAVFSKAASAIYLSCSIPLKTLLIFRLVRSSPRQPGPVRKRESLITAWSYVSQLAKIMSLACGGRLMKKVSIEFVLRSNESAKPPKLKYHCSLNRFSRISIV